MCDGDEISEAHIPNRLIILTDLLLDLAGLIS